MRFQDLQPGLAFPPVAYTVTEEAIRAYGEAVGDLAPLQAEEGPAAHPTLAAVFQLEAFRVSLPNRPPGNVHVSQRYVFHRPIRPGETVETVVQVCETFTRKERNFVRFALDSRVAGEPVVSGEMTTLWAE